MKVSQNATQSTKSALSRGNNVTMSAIRFLSVLVVCLWMNGMLFSFLVTHKFEENDMDLKRQYMKRVDGTVMAIPTAERKLKGRIDSHADHQLDIKQMEHVSKAMAPEDDGRRWAAVSRERRGESSHSPPYEQDEALDLKHRAPVQDKAKVKVVKTEKGCTLEPRNNDPEAVPSHDLHYGRGFVHRDEVLRGVHMTVSGAANAGSGCAMSPKYKFIYVHVLKSAGMTIKAFLKNALCGSTDLPCRNGQDKLQIVNCASAIRSHPEYFVWSFIRNPFSRFFSGYAMAEGYGRRNTAVTRVAFEDFALHPRQRGRRTRASPDHFLPQHLFLFDRRDCPVFDYLGHLENFDEDMKTVLEFIGSPELLDYVQERNGTVHIEASTAYGNARRSRELSNDPLRSAFARQDVQQSVANEFAHDFRLFGYDARAIPVN